MPDSGKLSYSHNNEYVVYQAQRFMKSAIDKSQRFFAMVAFTTPHTPLVLDALSMPLEATPVPERRRGRRHTNKTASDGVMWPTEEARTARAATVAAVNALLPSDGASKNNKWLWHGHAGTRWISLHRPAIAHRYCIFTAHEVP